MNLNLGFFRYVWYWIIKFGSKIVEITTKNSNSLYNGIRNFHFSEFANSISYSHISLSINLLPLRRYWFTFNSHEFLSEAATGGVMLKKSVFGNFAKFIYFFSENLVWFLVTPVWRFALLPYYQRIMLTESKFSSQ